MQTKSIDDLLHPRKLKQTPNIAAPTIPRSPGVPLHPPRKSRHDILKSQFSTGNTRNNTPIHRQQFPSHPTSAAAPEHVGFSLHSLDHLDSHFQVALCPANHHLSIRNQSPLCSGNGNNGIFLIIQSQSQWNTFCSAWSCPCIKLPSTIQKKIKY
jgi:hypothetical protein